LSSQVDRRAVLRTARALAALTSGWAGGWTSAAGADAPVSPGSTPYATEIAPGVFSHKGHFALVSPANLGDISNNGFIVGRDGVAVIDTGGSEKVGADLHKAIRATTDRPIRYVINTHMHPDHVFGNAAFKDDGPEFVGHAKLARALAARSERYLAVNKELLGVTAFAGIAIIPPTRPVEDRLSLDLGGRTLEVEAQKTAHTDNDLVVRDSATQTLFLGDLLFSGHVPVIDGSIRGWLAFIDRAAAMPAARVVPGHGPPSMPWPAAIEPQKRYLERLAADVRALIKAGKTLSDATATAGRSEKDAWELFDEYHARNATTAFAELEWE
jgi:quinoprotein relay system zinc metallohydrolase 2